MARLLTVPEIYDPAVLLLRREEAADPLALTQHSYSQASAYVIPLCRFDWDAEALATHLRVVVRTLLTRLRWFGAWTRWQASLFDGRETIPLSFEATKARSFAIRAREPCMIDLQFAWPFAIPQRPGG
jgi:hypothetical protein